MQQKERIQKFEQIQTNKNTESEKLDKKINNYRITLTLKKQRLNICKKRLEKVNTNTKDHRVDESMSCLDEQKFRNVIISEEKNNLESQNREQMDQKKNSKRKILNTEKTFWI